MGNVYIVSQGYYYKMYDIPDDITAIYDIPTF